ncbi:DNA polymerase III subunit alpha [Candidatus Babeliales bacterium]|nr:DNA polymerase III subunit alpha [Candidatus Babeliales bacterium]
MDKHFTHLHLHTEYSLLDGAIRIKDLVKFAQEQKWKAVGISDHGNIFGAVKFFQECSKAKIKPILGCEMYITEDAKNRDIKNKYYHLLIIIQNKKGYENFCRLMAYAYKEGFYFKPRIDLATLKKYSEGLIIGTACLGGIINSLYLDGKEQEAKDMVHWFLDVFGKERFYLEVHPPDADTTECEFYEKQTKANKHLFELSEKMGVDCIVGTDAHYLLEEDREAHEVLLSVGTHALITDPNRYSFGEFRGHLKTEQDILKFFPDHEEALWNTGKIADMCDFNFEFGKLFFPKFDIPEKHTENSYFIKLCKDGLEELKQNNLVPKDQYKIYDQRLKLEMDLIIEMGFVGYFLVVSDFIRWAKKNNIPVGPGRGSVAGSLVAWAIEITGVDPIKYNLLFERFLNPERVSMPDIDIDFCIEKREEVINYVRDKYGHDCVCQIITFGTMMAKGVLKDVARTLGFPFKDANAITDLVPDQLKITINEAIEKEPRLKEMIETNPQVKKLVDISKKLEGLTRHASKHAAGVVISPKPLEEMLPLYIPSKTTELVAQYAMTELESVGFLKMDFLGLKNLTLIDRTLKAIKENHGIEINLEQLSFEDPKSFELLRKGKTSGIFQFESDGIKDVLRKLQPDKFEDLIAVNALYRPGPLGSGMVDDYIERRHGRKKTTYMFPELKPILEETYGVIVYQEQVMKIASTIAGYSLGGADILRRAMGKKKVEVMAEQKELFIKGAKEKGFDSKKAAELFELMAYFAGYGFNKSHSTAYALIAYHTAYLKANFPLEFMAALVSFETNNPDKLTAYLQEISDMGIETVPPNINNSEIEFKADKNKIIFGLQGIKNVGFAALQNIIEERKKNDFLDLLDFCYRVDLRVANKRVIENLINTGAMDCFPGNRAQKANELEKVISLALEKKEADKTGQTSLFNPGKSTKNKKEIYQFEACDDWTEKEKLEKEKELAGFYLSSHPLKTYNHILRWFNLPTFEQLLEKSKKPGLSKDLKVKAFGLMQNFRVINTKKGDKMAFAQFEDFSGNCEVVIFPKTFKKVEKLLGEHNVFLIKGNLELTFREKCKMIAESLIPIDSIFTQSQVVSRIDLEMPENITEEFCTKIKDHFKQKGSSFINVFFRENGENLILKSSTKVSSNQESLKELEGFGVGVHCKLF